MTQSPHLLLVRKAEWYCSGGSADATAARGYSEKTD
jgi:hypothetical protein